MSIITINKEDFERSKKFKFLKSYYLPGVGVNTSRFKIDADKNYIKKLLKIDSSQKVIVSVGELSNRKNQLTILKSMNYMNRSDIHYVLVGEGNKYSYFKKYIKKNNLINNVHFLGYRSDIPKILNSSNIFIHPSIREGFGIACIEAMASGKPIITSYINGIKDYSIQNKTGLYVKPKNYKEFSSKILELVGNDKLCKNIKF